METKHSTPKKRKNRKQETCYCTAYIFPHRKGGGRCPFKGQEVYQPPASIAEQTKGQLSKKPSLLSRILYKLWKYKKSGKGLLKVLMFWKRF